MANNFALITKSAGVVTPALDGSVFNAILPDVRLQGMAASYSGANVSFAAGSMLVGGRVINNPSASSIAMSATDDGYCWLIVTINNDALSFRQTTSEPTLTQNNINVSGTKYEAILCKVHITSSSIDALSYVMPFMQRTGGIVAGTSDTPAAGDYADNTLYIQYEA